MKRKILLLVFTLAALTLAIAPLSYATPATQPILIGSHWTVYNNRHTKANTIPSGGVEFSFPDASTPDYTHYLLNNFKAELTSSNTITAEFKVVASSSATAFVGNPSGGCPGSSSSLCPGAVRLFFQSNLPVAGVESGFCVGPGYNEDNYWWSNDGTTNSYYQLTTGSSPDTVTLSVSLEPAKWSNLCGSKGTDHPDAFNAAIANIKIVGLSFGSGYFFANGVGVNYTTGTETFQLLRYEIS